MTRGIPFFSAIGSWLALLRKVCPSLTRCGNERPPAADLLEAAIGEAQASADELVDDAGEQMHQRPRQRQEMRAPHRMSQHAGEFAARERLVVGHVIDAGGHFHSCGK